MTTKAYDPFDGLSSYLRPLTFYQKFPQQVLQQGVRRNPFNLRPLLGIKPHTSTKGMGFLAGGYLNLFMLTGEKRYEERTRWALDWLIAEQLQRDTPAIAGGMPSTTFRAGSNIPKHAPTVVWSGLIGHEFIEAWRALKDETLPGRRAQHRDAHPQGPAPVHRSRTGLVISYVTDAKLAVHNANLIGARMLAEVYRETGEKELL